MSVEGINFRNNVNSSAPVQANNIVGLAQNDLSDSKKIDPKELKGSSLAFVRPGLAEAQRYVEIQKALEETKFKDLPKQYDPANMIKALRNEDMAYQETIKGSARTVGIAAGGLGSAVGAAGALTRQIT